MSSFNKSTFREYIESIVVAVILALFIRTWVVQAFKIPTGSMEQNLLIGDHLLVNKFVFGPTALDSERVMLPIDSIERGDVIVFKYPEDPERDFIKRVIGLPGNIIELRDRQLYVDGQVLEEPYVYHFDFGGGRIINNEFDPRNNFGPVTVPPDQYFVMGDNRENSQDSRYWGFLPASHVKGRALLIYWSYKSDAEDYRQTSLTGTVQRLASVATHFFTRTRWERLLQQIR
jgi:signal peptidase I